MKEQWKEKVKELRPPSKGYMLSSHDIEQPANAWLAGRLRDLADHLETRAYPRVFSCDVPESGVSGIDGPISEFKVMLSYPWGG